MIILDSPDQKLECYIAGAVDTNQLHFVCNYIDITSSPYGYAVARGETDGVTPVVISGDKQKEFSQRRIKSISVRNKDTAAVYLTFRLNDDGDYFEIPMFVLQVDDTVFYEDGRGWYVLDKYGAPRQNALIPSQPILIFAAGTDNYSGTNPAIISLFDGLTVSVKIPNNNTGAVTLDVGFGADAVLNFVNSAFTVDELQAGGWYDLQFDGTNWLCKTVTDMIKNNV